MHIIRQRIIINQERIELFGYLNRSQDDSCVSSFFLCLILYLVKSTLKKMKRARLFRWAVSAEWLFLFNILKVFLTILKDDLWKPA